MEEAIEDRLDFGNHLYSCIYLVCMCVNRFWILEVSLRWHVKITSDPSQSKFSSDLETKKINKSSLYHLSILEHIGGLLINVHNHQFQLFKMRELCQYSVGGTSVARVLIVASFISLNKWSTPIMRMIILSISLRTWQTT